MSFASVGAEVEGESDWSSREIATASVAHCCRAQTPAVEAVDVSLHPALCPLDAVGNVPGKPLRLQ